VFKKDMLDAQGNFTDEGTRKFMQGFVDAFAAWVERYGKK
jgi:chromate reductase